MTKMSKASRGMGMRTVYIPLPSLTECRKLNQRGRGPGRGEAPAENDGEIHYMGFVYNITPLSNGNEF